MANGALLDYLRKPATKKELKIKDQIDMAAQCADGMAYLETTVCLINKYFNDNKADGRWHGYILFLGRH